MGKLDGADRGACAGRSDGSAGAIARARSRFIREATSLEAPADAPDLACRLLVEEGAGTRAWVVDGPPLAFALDADGGLDAAAQGELQDLAASVGLVDALLRAAEDRTRGLEETQRALRQSERRLAAAIEGSDDGIWDWDGVSDVNWTSDRWSTMLGFEPGELAPTIGAWHDLIHPDDFDAVIAANDALVQGRIHHYAYELRLRRKDGTSPGSWTAARWWSGTPKAVPSTWPVPTPT